MDRNRHLAPYEWLSLQELLANLHAQTDLALISPRNARLLEWIFKKRSLGFDLPLQSVREFSETAAGATIYQSLLELEQKGFIDISADPLDSRRKQIHTTEKTSLLMQRLSISVEHWASEIRSPKAMRRADGSNESLRSQRVRQATPVCTEAPAHRDGISTVDTLVPPAQEQPG
jgi:DNA-binding MarR family transcriptional regulator